MNKYSDVVTHMQQIVKVLLSVSILALISFSGCDSKVVNSPLALNNEVFMVTNHGSSRATGYTDSNKIIETESSIFISWLGNSSDEFKVQIVQFDKLSRTFSDVITVSNDVDDNHGGPAIVIDSNGYLHMLFGPHASQMRYTKSVRPYDITEWTSIEKFGSNLTYPSLVIDQNNTLYCVARQSNWFSDWPLVLYKKNERESWTSGVEILIGNYPKWKQNGYPFNNYPTNGYTRYSKSLSISQDGRLHLYFKIAEYLPDNLISGSQYENGIGTYMIGYIYSEDKGETWKANSRVLNLPATTDRVELIEGNSNPVSSKSVLDVSNLVTGRGGKPFALYSVASDTASALFLTFRENEEWKRIDISNSIGGHEEFLLSPSSLGIDEYENLYLMATSIPEENYCKCLDLWANPSNEIRVFKVSNNVVTAIPFEQGLIVKRPLWLPSAQHSTYLNNRPKFIFLSGGSPNGNSDLVENDVIFLYIE